MGPFNRLFPLNRQLLWPLRCSGSFPLNKHMFIMCFTSWFSTCLICTYKQIFNVSITLTMCHWIIFLLSHLLQDLIHFRLILLPHFFSISKVSHVKLCII